MAKMPAARPRAPFFSSGPCAKRPGWTLDNLKTDTLGRSHRAKLGKARLKRAIDLTREVLRGPGRLPHRHRAGLRHRRGRDGACGRCSAPGRSTCSPGRASARAGSPTSSSSSSSRTPASSRRRYGELPDLAEVDTRTRDVVFTWNGTTSGVRVPDADWIAADREGLTICDATSAAFAQGLDFAKLDVVTFSWQKALGGEAAHGMLILSPRAVERLETYTPAWPLPKIFRLTSGGKLIEGIFEGETINTPSMLCVEDYIDALEWAKARRRPRRPSIAKADANAEVIARLGRPHALDRQPRQGPGDGLQHQRLPHHRRPGRGRARAPTRWRRSPRASRRRSRRRASPSTSAPTATRPPGLRIWCGATVEASDLEALTPWLDWAFAQEKAKLAQGGLSRRRLVIRRAATRTRGRQRLPHDRDPADRRLPHGRAGRAMTPQEPIHAPAPRSHLRRPLARRRADLQGSRRRRSISSPISARTRTSSPPSSATMTASPSAPPPR